MAGSRLEKFGTVFTRVRDLLLSGVMKPSEKPVWYDVYKAFPPTREPVYVQIQRKTDRRKVETVADIFYEEDVIRAKFYQIYFVGRPFDLTKSNFVSTPQRFVNKYMKLKSLDENNSSSDRLFEETGKALLAEGIVLKRRGDSMVAARFRNPVLTRKLTDMLAEAQTDGPAEIPETEHNTKES